MAIEFVDIEDLTLVPGRELSGSGEFVQVSATEKTSVADIAEFTLLEMERSGRPVYRLKGDYFSMYTGAVGTVVSQMMEPDGGFAALKELTCNSLLFMSAGDAGSLVRLLFQSFDEEEDKIVWEFVSRDFEGVPVYNRYEIWAERMVKRSERMVMERRVLPAFFASVNGSTASSLVEAAVSEAGSLPGLYEEVERGLPFYINCSDGALVRLLSVKVSMVSNRMEYSFVKDTSLVYVVLSKSGSQWQVMSVSRDLMAV